MCPHDVLSKYYGVTDPSGEGNKWEGALSRDLENCGKLSSPPLLNHHVLSE